MYVIRNKSTASPPCQCQGFCCTYIAGDHCYAPFTWISLLLKLFIVCHLEASVVEFACEGAFNSAGHVETMPCVQVWFVHYSNPEQVRAGRYAFKHFAQDNGDGTIRRTR